MKLSQISFLRALRDWNGIASPRDLGPQTSQEDNYARQYCKSKGWVTYDGGYWRLTDAGRAKIAERDKPRIDFTRPGRMISGSKTAPPGHVCVFNANVYSKSKGKIWFGDIDLTEDADDLRRLAIEQGEEIYILRERDGRFTNEENPLLHKAVARFAPGAK